MSEGDPYKRQKVSEDILNQSSEDMTLKYQNACLSLKLKEQREEISKLQTQTTLLTQKIKSLEDFINNFNIKWAKTISDLNTLCVELAVNPVTPNPFEIFIQDSGGLEQLSEISKKCLSRLLEAIEKVSDYETGTIVENCKDYLNVNSIQSENMRLKIELSRYKEESLRLGNEVDELNMKRMNLEVRLIKKGDFNVETSSDKGEDVGEIKRQRDEFEKRYKDEIIKKSKSNYVKNVSFEHFIKSRTFKEVIQNAQKLKSRMEDYRKKYNELYEYRIKFKEKFKKECEYIEDKEQEKREELEKKVKKFMKEASSAESFKNEAAQMLEIQQKVQAEQKSSNNFAVLIELLSKDKEALKGENLKLKEQIEMLNKQIEKYESIQNPNSTDPELQKVHKLLEELKKKLRSEQQKSENLIKEIEVTENAYESIEEKIKLVTTQLVQQEELYNKLMSEKVKEASWKSVHDQETQAYENKIKSLESITDTYKTILNDLEKQLKIKDELIDSLAQKCKELENKVRDVYEKYEEGIMRTQELLEYKKDYIAGLKRAEENFVDLSKEKMQLEDKLKEGQETMKKLESDLKRKDDPSNLKSIDETLNKEVAYYRRIIRCSVCCSNNKDTILSKCLHVFCKGCLTEHLHTRKRKCPLCKNRFNQEDMKNFTWDTA